MFDFVAGTVTVQGQTVKVPIPPQVADLVNKHNEAAFYKNVK